MEEESTSKSTSTYLATSHQWKEVGSPRHEWDIEEEIQDYTSIKRDFDINHDGLEEECKQIMLKELDMENKGELQGVDMMSIN